MHALYFLLAAALVAVDQVVKYLVRAGIPLHTAVDFLPGLDLTYVQNTGAGLFPVQPAHLAAHPPVRGGVRGSGDLPGEKESSPTGRGCWPWPFCWAGPVGNFIDRLLFGFVTDMFATTFVNFAVFNVADVGVVLGGVLLCLHLIVFFGREGKKEPDKEETP